MNTNSHQLHTCIISSTKLTTLSAKGHPETSNSAAESLRSVTGARNWHLKYNKYLLSFVEQCKGRICIFMFLSVRKLSYCRACCFHALLPSVLEKGSKARHISLQYGILLSQAVVPLLRLPFK